MTEDVGSSPDVSPTDRGLTPTGAIYALFTFMGFVVFVPAWMFWIDNRTGELGLEAMFLATLVLPATVLLYLSGWIQS